MWLPTESNARRYSFYTIEDNDMLPRSKVGNEILIKLWNGHICHQEDRLFSYKIAIQSVLDIYKSRTTKIETDIFDKMANET